MCVSPGLIQPVHAIEDWHEGYFPLQKYVLFHLFVVLVSSKATECTESVHVMLSVTLSFFSAAGDYLDMTPYILPDSLELMHAKDVSELRWHVRCVSRNVAPPQKSLVSLLVILRAAKLCSSL